MANHLDELCRLLEGPEMLPLGPLPKMRSDG